MRRTSLTRTVPLAAVRRCPDSPEAVGKGSVGGLSGVAVEIAIIDIRIGSSLNWKLVLTSSVVLAVAFGVWAPC